MSNGETYEVLIVIGRSPRNWRMSGSMSGVVKKYMGVLIGFKKRESQEE